MAFRCFFSGVESDQHWGQCVSAGVKNVLMSYWQFYQRSGGLIAKRKAAHPQMRFLIDSGAHSFIVDWEKFKSWKQKDFEDYVKGYAKWLEENRQHIFAAVELDIDYCLNMVLGGDATSTVGDAMVERWQREYFAPLEAKGLSIIYVWHENRGMAGWEDMCARHGYVGLPGEFSKKPDFNKYMAVARRYTARVHGFAASVTGDSTLFLKTAEGLQVTTIAELFDQCTSVEKRGAEEWGTLPFKCRTWSLTDTLRSTYEVVSRVMRHKIRRPLYEIRLRGGKTIRGTGDHSFFTLDRHGTLHEAKPVDLKVGDCLVSSLGMPKRTTDVPTAEEIQFMEFLGLWFGDGYVNQRKECNDLIWVSKQHQPEIRAVCDKVARMFASKWCLASELDGYCYAPVLGKLIVENFGRTGPEKYIGNLVLNSPLWCQAAFLRGYFSADGSAKGVNKLISLTCVKRAPLAMVQLLLEQWDIRSGLSQETRRTGKDGDPCWELAISDELSRAIFAREIGFIQAEQNAAIAAKSTATHAAGAHRGLPVSLLREPGRLYYRRQGSVKGRSVYAKDRRTAEIPENFVPALLNMECEYLEIAAITELPSESVWVYDLEVPTTQRFFANGILAHNTKQMDFAEIPWYSGDSITWKTGEMYGTLIDWDPRAQKLTFIDNKAERIIAKDRMDRNGFDTSAVLGDSNYKEVTRFSLWSMRQMEAFYAHKYKERLYYYELRLPADSVIAGWSDRAVMKRWAKFRPDSNFPRHASASPVDARRYLQAISVAQSGDLGKFAASNLALNFFRPYLPKIIEPLTTDSRMLQRELSYLVAPTNPPATPRTELAHIEPNSNSAKVRTRRNAVDFSALDADWSAHPLLANESEQPEFTTNE